MALGQPHLGTTADALSDEFTVVAWDEPGAGGSDDVPDQFCLSDYADCLAGMIRALALAPTPVVGLSWGTTVILELYRRHPVVVAQLGAGRRVRRVARVPGR